MRRTNVQEIKRIMEYSNYGALAQAFIIDAIYKMADAVSQADPAQMETGMVTGAAWVGVAKEIKEKLDKHLDRNRT